MFLLQKLLLPHLTAEVETGDLEPSVIQGAIEAVENILKYELRKPPPEDERQRYCTHVLSLFQNFDPTRASFTIIQDILKLLVYLSRMCDHLDYFVLNGHLGQLLDVLVVLSASNFCQSREPFKKMNEMLERLFLRRGDDYSQSFRATIVSAAILDNLLSRWKYAPRNSREKLQLTDIVLKLLKRLLSKDKHLSELAKHILKDCKDSLYEEINKVFYPILEKTSTDIPRQFKDQEAVHNTIIQLYIVDPTLILSLYKRIEFHLTNKGPNPSREKRENAIIFMFKLFTRANPDDFFTPHWKHLQYLFFSGRMLSERESDLLCEYSPELLTESIYDIRYEWIDCIVNLARNCPSQLAVRLLDIFAQAEKRQPNYFAIKEVCLRMADLLRAGSKQQLVNDLLRKSFLQSLCKVYLGHLKKNNFNAASNLAYFILDVFNSLASGPKDWALARVVIRLLTAEGTKPLVRAWHLVVLYSFCKAEREATNKDVNKPLMLRAVLEADRYSPQVHTTLQELLELQGASEELQKRFSRKLVCEMTIGYANYTLAMDFIVKKVTTDRAVKDKLKQITSYSSTEDQRKKAKDKFTFPKHKLYTQYAASVFPDIFFATVEPLANDEVMSALVMYLDREVKRFVGEEGSAMDSGSNATDDITGYGIVRRNMTGNRPLPEICDFEAVALTIYATILGSPHQAFRDDATLKTLLLVVSNQHRRQLDVNSFALKTILAALNCHCTDEERQDPGHVRWTEEQWFEIKNSCRPILGIMLELWTDDEDIDNELLKYDRSVLKLIIRIYAHSENPTDLNPLVQQAVETLQDNETYSSPYARQLSVAAMGFIAGEPSLKEAYKRELTVVFMVLLHNLSNLRDAVAFLDTYQLCKKIGSDEFSPGLLLRGEEYRTLGRIIKFCLPAVDVEFAINCISRSLLPVAIPQDQRILAPMNLEPSDLHQAWILFNSRCAGILRKDAVVAVLTMLENESLRYSITVDIVLTLAEVAMDPIPEVRYSFTEKLNYGLCFIKCWATDNGKRKGTLDLNLAALIPLTCLYKADSLREIDTMDRFMQDAQTTYEHLIVYVKSQRLFIHRLHHYVVPEDSLPNMDNILYDLPEFYPEFILCWLVPVLAKLDILSWYTSYKQLGIMNNKQMTIVILIYNCFEVVLKAMISKNALRPFALPYKIIKDLPSEVLKFMRFESYQERERQAFLCMLLCEALEVHKKRSDFDDQPFDGTYDFRHILAKGPLFYDIEVQRNNGYFAPRGNIFQEFIVKMKKKQLSVAFSDETFSTPSSRDDDQTSPQQSESRSESSSTSPRLSQRSHLEPASVQPVHDSSTDSTSCTPVHDSSQSAGNRLNRSSNLSGNVFDSSSLSGNLFSSTRLSQLSPFTNRSRRGPASQIDVAEEGDIDDLPELWERGRPNAERATVQGTDSARLRQIPGSRTIQGSDSLRLQQTGSATTIRMDSAELRQIAPIEEGDDEDRSTLNSVTRETRLTGMGETAGQATTQKSLADIDYESSDASSVERVLPHSDSSGMSTATTVLLETARQGKTLQSDKESSDASSVERELPHSDSSGMNTVTTVLLETARQGKTLQSDKESYDVSSVAGKIHTGAKDSAGLRPSGGQATIQEGIEDTEECSEPESVIRDLPSSDSAEGDSGNRDVPQQSDELRYVTTRKRRRDTPTDAERGRKERKLE